MLCIDFVLFIYNYLFLKGQILREFQNTEKFIIFLKKHDLKKGCITMFSMLASTKTRQKRLNFYEKSCLL